MTDQSRAGVWEPDDFEDFDDDAPGDRATDEGDEGDKSEGFEDDGIDPAALWPLELDADDLPTAAQLEEAGFDLDDV